MPTNPKVAELARRKAQFDSDFDKDIDGLIAAYDELDRAKAKALDNHHAAMEQRRADLVMAGANVADLAGLTVGNEVAAPDQKKT